MRQVGGHSSSRCAGLSLSRPLLLRSTGSRCAGSVVVVYRPSRSVACGIFPDQGSNPCPLHWQADSQPLCHQGSPRWTSYSENSCPYIVGKFLQLFYLMFFFPSSLFFLLELLSFGCCISRNEIQVSSFVCFIFLSHFYLLFLFYSRYWKIVSTLPSNALVEVLDNNLLVSSFLRAFHVSLIFLNCYSFMGTTSFLGKNHILCSLFVLDPTSVLKFSL